MSTFAITAEEAGAHEIRALHAYLRTQRGPCLMSQFLTKLADTLEAGDTVSITLPEVEYEINVYREVILDPDFRDEEGEFAAVCGYPGCTSHEFYEVDKSIRWNETVLTPYYRADQELPFLMTNQGDDFYETDYWMCQGKHHKVSIPEWLDTEWS